MLGSVDAGERLSELAKRDRAGFLPRPAERAEQAAARAVAHLELYFREDRRQGDRRELEHARKALDEALDLAS